MTIVPISERRPRLPVAGRIRLGIKGRASNDAMENVTSEIESYQEETGRDEKADARESALGAIEELLSAIEEYEALPDMPELSESGPIQVIDVKEVPTRELTV